MLVDVIDNLEKLTQLGFIFQPNYYGPYFIKLPVINQYLSTWEQAPQWQTWQVFHTYRNYIRWWKEPEQCFFVRKFSLPKDLRAKKLSAAAPSPSHPRSLKLFQILSPQLKLIFDFFLGLNLSNIYSPHFHANTS